MNLWWGGKIFPSGGEWAKFWLVGESPHPPSPPVGKTLNKEKNTISFLHSKKCFFHDCGHKTSTICKVLTIFEDLSFLNPRNHVNNIQRLSGRDIQWMQVYMMDMVQKGYLMSTRYSFFIPIIFPKKSSAKIGGEGLETMGKIQRFVGVGWESGCKNLKDMKNRNKSPFLLKSCTNIILLA